MLFRSQVGSPLDLYEHPVNIFVAGFIGSPRMNFLPSDVLEASAQHALLRLHNGASIRCDVDGRTICAGDKVTLGVRPEHLTSDVGPNVIHTTVNFVESLGSTTHAYCVFPGVEDALTCELSGRSRIKAGNTLELSVPPECTYVFDSSGKALQRLSANTVAEATRSLQST